MSKRSNYLFYVVLLSWPCSLFVLNSIWKKKENKLNANYSLNLYQAKKELDRTKQNLLANYPSVDFVNDLLGKYQLEKQKGDEQLFQSVFNGEKHLVLLFHDDVCPVCIELEIKRLLKMDKSDRVVFLTSNANKRFVKVLQIQYKFDFEVFFMNSTSLLHEKKASLPLYFISDGITNSHFFITDKSQPDLTDEYIHYVSNNI